MKYTPLPAAFFTENRRRLAALLPPKSVAIFYSSDQAMRNGDGLHPFRQNSDLYYLSGIDQEESMVIIAPDSPIPGMKEVVVLRRTDDVIAVWEGHKYNKEEARKTSGIETILWADELPQTLRTIIHHSENIFLNTNENDRAVVTQPYQDLRRAQELRQEFPLHSFKRVAPLMLQLRTIKQPAEVAAMKKACDITTDTFEDVLAMLKPGVMEYEVEAAVLSGFIRRGATGPAYCSIIASGASACVLHYVENNRKCKDGDLILMDFGAEYALYAADLTRTVPVNGKFTERQRDVYNAVLRVHRQARELLRPGRTLDELNRQVGGIMEGELLSLGLLNPEEVAKQDPAAPLYKRYFMHGTSHFLGLDVHDVGDRYAPMQAGMVFSCEPGIYIPEEQIGIRIETDVLITETGFEDFLDNCPIEVDEIEALMAEAQQC